jgi:hypothetical protein
MLSLVESALGNVKRRAWQLAVTEQAFGVAVNDVHANGGDRSGTRDTVAWRERMFTRERIHVKPWEGEPL